MRRTLTTAVFALALAFPLHGERTTPPPPAAPRSVTVPQPAEKTLANGMRVIVIEKKGLPLVAARLMIKAGAEADPADRAGLADMTASLLNKGTKRGTKSMSAEQIAREVEALGATLESGGAWDFSYVALSTLSTTFDSAMNFVGDVAMNPVFAAEEIERLRAQNVDALSVALKDPESLSGFVAARLVYGAEPYGHNLGGTPKSLTQITRADIVAFHEKNYRPDNAILVIAGNVEAAEAFATAERVFSTWKAGDTSAAATGVATASVTPSTPAPRGRVVVIDMPDAGQAAVVVTRRGIARTDPAFITGQVANMILGGDYSSRLNQEVRIKRGLSYGAGSSFDARREPGPFTASAQTKNESAIEVAGLMTGEVSKMTSTSVAESELTPRKANLVGRFGRSIETTSGLVSRLATLALYGLPLTDINHYVADVQAVTGEAVQKFSTGTLGAGNADVVIVGDLRKFGATFKQQFPNAEIIPIDSLDLDSPALRK